jgi:hypothetical protein
MEHDDLSQVDPVSLADLMDCRSDREETWSAGDLEAILEHQLGAEVQFDLERFDEALGLDLPKMLDAAGKPPIRSFRDLFEHPQPPIELLDLTRRFAKACRSRGDSPIPAEIATILYLASIAVAMVRRKRRLTVLADEALCNGFDWALGKSWLDESTHQLLRQGREALESHKSESDV